MYDYLSMTSQIFFLARHRWASRRKSERCGDTTQYASRMLICQRDSRLLKPLLQKMKQYCPSCKRWSLPSRSYDLILIVSQMTSPDSSERKWSCVAVSNLIQNDPSTRRLLQGKNIVAALITRLTDDDEEVVVEAAGALRCVLLFHRMLPH